MQVLWVFFEAFKDNLRDDDARSTVFHLFQMELASSNQQWLAAFNLLGLNSYTTTQWQNESCHIYLNVTAL